jgi:hypothetical protein
MCYATGHNSLMRQYLLQILQIMYNKCVKKLCLQVISQKHRHYIFPRNVCTTPQKQARLSHSVIALLCAS